VQGNHCQFLCVSLSIEQAIARIPFWRGAPSVTVSPLGGGITNFNYRVDVGGEAFVVRVWAKDAGLLGIDRHREHQCTLAASRTGVGPEVVHFLPDEGILVTRFIEGRCLSAGERAGPETMERVVRSMHRYHAGPAFDGFYSPFRTVEAYLHAARRYGTSLPDDIDGLYARMREIEVSLQREGAIIRPCHNDLWGPNLIDDGKQVRIVDWEYAGMGDVYFDLADFANYHSASDADDRVLLRLYFGDTSEIAFTRLKLMKIVAQLREAMWYVVAINLSSAKPDFSDYAERHFDRSRQALDDARLPSWLDMVARGG
jgi:thiamine kinase-like enzyme